MSLDQENVKRIATLARLKLSLDQIRPMQKDLNSILHFIDQLNEVDTSSINPSESINLSSMPFRIDQVSDGNYVEKIMINAPEIACNMFVVPKVVE